jgi:hypothetical protein
MTEALQMNSFGFQELSGDEMLAVDGGLTWSIFAQYVIVGAIGGAGGGPAGAASGALLGGIAYCVSNLLGWEN